MRIHLFSAIIHSKINKFRNEPFSILVTRHFYDTALNLSIGTQMFYRITHLKAHWEISSVELYF